ncbi:glycosyltransferase family 2 protein [Reichenbachiella sp. MALMAid0571]|uniref:glycosyltransferase family 2 protein n=1 Tax=Reichenbachiella sp. MALMAid0571 TaxID=3143939 RepID=UPI0032DF0ADF
MKISVITVCRNSAKTIGQTIESVQSQSHENIEHIFCDGGSSDNTVGIIKNMGGENVTLLEGEDKGIYDAINKGIRYASGDIVAILNSDDFYSHDKVLEKVVNAFDTGVDAVYGDLIYVNPINTNKVVRYWRTGSCHPRKFLWGWTVPHPVLFIKKSIYDEHGLYDSSFKIAGDYDLILRLLYKAKISVHYLPEVMVNMRTGGVSNGSFSKKIKVHKEDTRAWKTNNIKPNLLTLWLKPLRKTGQYFFHKIKE